MSTIIKNNRPIKVIISGGGTGGHVFPAIAIADAIKEKRPAADILFVGAQGKIEMDRVPKAGYPIKGLWISGFHRKLTLRNLLFPLKLIHSLFKAWQITSSFKPEVAVGVGGYASGPVLEIATRKKIPAVIQEQNSYAGATNRILANKVDKVCVAYEKMDRFFPQDKIIQTGNPVRKKLFDKAVDKANAYEHFGLDPNKKTIFLFGGSLGASSLNATVAANTAFFKKHADIQLLWQVGKLYFDQYRTSEVAQLPNVFINTFIDHMDLAYGLADVVICRAGALTIAELCMVGQAAILVPSPNVAEDHQTKNAMALVEQDAAIMITDKESKDSLFAAALELMEDESKRQHLSDNIKAMARPDAAEQIADEVIKLAEQ
ncbi:MAG: undecaprenyldiphospho-muramoylpentapeptide beta-N-acetylglucosaminyltransferase [Bacteroidota bacterium]